MRERQPIVAGQREIADAGQAERHRDLIGAGRRERRLEAPGIDAEQRAAENDGRNRNDEDS